MQSKATLEETKLIFHCLMTGNFRTIGVSTFITLVLLLICIPVSNQDCVPADCLEQVVNIRTEEILYQKAFLSPRPPPENVLKDAWQVQHEDYHQRVTRTGKLEADEGKMERE